MSAPAPTRGLRVALAPDVCPACLEGGARRRFERNGAHFRRCRHCRSLFLEVRPDPDPTLYADETYFGNRSDGVTGVPGYRDYLSDRREIEEKFDLLLAQVERRHPPGELLDVGAGPGFLVGVARERGWNASGLDVNPWAADYARRELGVEVKRGTLEEAGIGEDAFDVVTMLDLIEHLDDPDRLIAEAARVTRHGGLLVVLTPDAGSLTTRLVGARWPEVQRVPEHMVLFSVDGLSEVLRRHGFAPVGWHWVGKRSSLETLVGDLSPVAPTASRIAHDLLARTKTGHRRFELDPRAKFCLYARRVGDEGPLTPSTAGPVRAPRIAKRPAPVDTAILEELQALAHSRRLCDWMFDQYSGSVDAAVAEVGAGIGTFSERILGKGAGRLLALEPDESCSAVLRRRFGADPRVQVVAEGLPQAPSLSDGAFDLVVCQNVLEHIEDDAAAVAAMGAALKPGGELALLVPAHPRLFGALDEAYGHYRRYTPERLLELIELTGLELIEAKPFNTLGILGWWLKNHRPDARIGRVSLALYEHAVRVWRPLERLLRPRWGLSLVARARRPGSQ